jgi:glutaminyl-tRNA synthetase
MAKLPAPKNFIEEIITADLASGRTDGVVTRFPPEPNGYLHIGHAKSICLNFGIAKRFGGKCNLRYDDTNPAKEEEEYCRAIAADVKWLGWKGDIFYGSDYFDEMFACAVRLIKKGKAYVCALNADEIREYRGTLNAPGKDSPYRNRGVEENLKLFYEMRDGIHADGALTLRAKIDMTSPNMNLRDPILYRVLHAPHHRQGNKWCIYPMYDFAHPIEDAVEKITHSICTLEFEDHRPLYDWVIAEGAYTPPPHQYEFARLNLTQTIMSKRYLKRLVDDGAVDGWDDPRMPTLAGIRRRGYPAAAVRDFCERIGVSKAGSEADAGLLEHCVRESLNLSAPRVMAVLDPVPLYITSFPDGYAETVTLENNPNDAKAGVREIPFSGRVWIDRADFAEVPPPKYHRLTPGGAVRLKGAYIVACDRIEKAADGSVTAIYAHHIEGSRSGTDTSGVKVKGVIHWVDIPTGVDLTCHRFDYLLLPATDGVTDFSERLNPASKATYADAKGEPMLADAKKGKALQFMRIAYFCRDPKSEGKRLVYHEIVGLKEGYRPT